MDNDKVQSLHDAILEDDHFSLQTALKEISNVVDYREDDGASLLHLSVRFGNARLTKYFIQAGCDINGQDKEGNVPLMSAIKLECEDERLSQVNLLLEAGARLDIKNSYEEDVLNACIVGEDDDGCDDLAIAKVLLDAGADVNMQDRSGKTPLYKAAYYLRTESVNFFLNHGADPNITDNKRKTALHAAARPVDSIHDGNRQEQLSILLSLLHHGANVNVRDRKKQTPLAYALGYGSREAIESLLENGASLCEIGNKSSSPMHYAAKNYDLNALRLLLDKGCDVNEQDKFGRTALHQAVECGMVKNIILLYENGAKINAKDKDGLTPLTFLIYSSDHIADVEMIADLLIDFGADVNVLTKYNTTIFDMAAGDRSMQYLVVRLIAKLEFFGKEIHHLVMKGIDKIYRFSEYYERCLLELSEIQDYVLYDKKPILPIFLGDQQIIARYMLNRELVEAFDAINFSKTFPIYEESINRKFEAERVKCELRSDALKLLSSLLPEEIRNVIIVRKIVDYLDSMDLVKLLVKYGKYYIHPCTYELRFNEFYSLKNSEIFNTL